MDWSNAAEVAVAAFTAGILTLFDLDRAFYVPEKLNRESWDPHHFFGPTSLGQSLSVTLHWRCH